ncbi:AP-5 complex subunit beta-1-like [Oopsacas minuta]|uniref:AP-5 complex subunit beta-1-like n=1 Tax=Oopsacas minuta TaxID=111878 RepID=A0AAV7JWS2_9METZ|nr:AP-5 complex subunit beta-1-like [Oopsacas minuta]
MTTKPQTANLFGNEWARDINMFLANPTSFISKSSKTTDLLIDDMLMIISTSSTILSLKLAILHVFLNVELFQTSKSYLTKIVTALEYLSSQFVEQKDNLFLHQLLAALTTLSIELDERFLHDSIQLTKCVDLLLIQANQVADGTRSERVLVRSAACICLSELEEVYPGILYSKLSYLFQYCQLEKTFIRQYYLSLFCTVLRHSLLKFKSIEFEEQANSLQFFFSPTTVLIPFIPPKNFREESAHLLCSSVDCVMSPNLEKVDLKKSFSTLLDASTNMTHTMLANTMHKLSDCVLLAGTHPSILKILYHRYIHSSSIVLLQLVYSLKAKFGRELFDIAEESSFERSIFWALNNPHNLNPHTLLLYTWLIHFPILDPITHREDNRVPNGLPLFQLCYPTPFDSIDLTVRCFHLFSASELILEEPRSINTHLSVLVQRVKSQPGSYATAAFFHTLYLFLHRSHPALMIQSIRVILTDLYLSYPMLAPYLINFMLVITSIVPANNFAIPMLSYIVKHLQTLRQVRTADLMFHLQLVEYAALTPKFNLDSLLVLLHSVLQPEVLEEGDWHLGHTILDVCRALLLGIHSDSQFQRACALLYRIRAKYTDVDVCNEAGFLLILITSVSTKKYRPLLSKASETNAEPSLKDLVVGTTFQLTAPITHIPEVILQLEKMPNKTSSSSTAYSNPPTVTRDPTEILKQYLTATDQLIDTSFQLNFNLSYAPHAKPSTSMQTIYAISLHLSDNPHYHPTASITIPKLVYKAPSENDKRNVSFEFRPKLPFPAQFSVSAIFSLQDGATYQTPLAHLEVSFSDLVLPIPLPQEISEQDTPALFEALWSHLSRKCFSEKNTESKCTESFIKLNKPSESVTRILLHTLSPNIVTSSDNLIQLLLYIPPRHHILMKARVSPDSTDVSILTDEWRLLSYFNQYMHTLLAQM